MTTLLDSSVVIALLRAENRHHWSAEAWFRETDGSVATCPISQGALVRLVLQRGESITDALGALNSLTTSARHSFWPDDLSYAELPPRGVVGHKQVTDAYLAELARRRGGRIATLDQALADLHSDVAELVPTS